MSVEVVVASRLDRPADLLWPSVTHLAWLAEELRPWLRMTTPRGLLHSKDWDGALAGVPVGVPLGRSWLLLGGVLPVEYDDLRLESFGPGRFVERSRLGSARSWRHERTVVPDGDRAVLTDHLALEPRRAVPAGLARRVVSAVFAHRHRRLRARFGGEEVRTPCPR